jgi:nucleoside-diphosphate-sugar epimerase
VKILITGASGFVGQSLLRHLHKNGHQCIGASREKTLVTPEIHTHAVGDIRGAVDWSPLLDGVECVVHLAARAHLLRDDASNPQGAFDEVNLDATMSLVRQAQEAGVKRFVYVSSIGVHGAATENFAITESSSLAPHSPYARSKLKAEDAIREYLADKAMGWVIVRPPLIYAAGAPGNFGLLLKLVDKGYPLPFYRVHNARSLLSLDNFVDFLGLCASDVRAAGEIFVVSDGVDFSIGEIIKLLAEGMSKTIRLFPVPDVLVRFGAGLLRRENTYVQLYGSLQVDSSKARRVLDWQPVVNGREGLINAGRYFKLRR